VVGEVLLGGQHLVARLGVDREQDVAVADLAQLAGSLATTATEGAEDPD